MSCWRSCLQRAALPSCLPSSGWKSLSWAPVLFKLRGHTAGRGLYTHTYTLLMPGGMLLLQHCPETHEQVAFNVWAQERAGEPCRGEKEKDKCKQKATGTMFSNTTALKQCPFFACLTPLTNYLLKTHLKVLIKTTNLSINFVHFKIAWHAHMGKCLNVTFKYFYIKYFCIKICMQFVFVLVVHNFILMFFMRG